MGGEEKNNIEYVHAHHPMDLNIRLSALYVGYDGISTQCNASSPFPSTSVMFGTSCIARHNTGTPAHKITFSRRDEETPYATRWCRLIILSSVLVLPVNAVHGCVSPSG